MIALVAHGIMAIPSYLFGEALPQKLMKLPVNPAYKSLLTLWQSIPLSGKKALTSICEELLNKAANIFSNSASVSCYAWNGVGKSLTAGQTDRAISLV